ncbi:hypothetical protein MTX26_29120 [Bradyrhizobium sp. ISRA443]|uniref:hypothetical protein n=1 Tax=unclassified Bradyrhizobium TaxID=2631580 RepID=UPI00247A9D5A|nr:MULTISPECIES: hypothetical protein [unclassified Bradyrhizobium]WGR93701.1 hypothetical protein MTX20_04020 [Bradyrhizobium sp. ISRA435]WGR98279.1 hypothetical protein MTX23_29110 [Bradyrhizobium sp. ISRA436]WGS05167.1 hypothetical protein MTX18_29125 [Bradyrhizobium sp. ISRA437]WGS12053.1 hypothetical protein MTX26_29120 [Bradyrhizobium sp. ISRA443]
MSASFERLIDGIIDALQSHVVPNSNDDFVRGQVFSAIYALNGLKLAADWKAGPLLDQVRLQDHTFAAVKRLADGMTHPEIPATPRIPHDSSDAAAIEGLRDDGDRRLGQLLLWASGEGARAVNRAVATEIEHLLRRAICDQLKIELATTPKSMLQQIAGDGGAAQG